MVRVLHTADWHLGYVPGQFEEEDARKLARARLDVVDSILGLARRHDVQAVLCAGDLFDTPEPAAEWWQGLLGVLQRHASWGRPVLLLPGNHDPLRPGSVYLAGHPFRRGLPDWVHVVDRRDFAFELSPEAVVLGAPCTSTAGDTDLALTLPARAPGDVRIRIGLVHGSTFDLPGYDTAFPISRDAAERRGLDYLAIGDTHSFREVVPGARAPIVYPGAPEATSFDEEQPGCVALVTFRSAGARPIVYPQRVGRWHWREQVVESMEQLRSLVDEDLTSTVLRLRLRLQVSLDERDELDRILERLRGSIAVTGEAGALVVDDALLRTDVAGAGLPPDVPETVRRADALLRQRAGSDAVAARAVLLLRRLLTEIA